MPKKVQYHIWSDNLKEKLSNLKNSKANIQIFAAEEYEVGGGFDALQIKHRGQIDWVFGRANVKEHENVHKVGNVYLWWNHFLFKSFEPLQIDHLNLSNDIFKKTYITLNTIGHQHRCFLLDNIYRNDMQEYGYISWHNKSVDEHYRFKHFIPRKITLDKQYKKTFIQNRLPEHFDTAFVNLVSESTVDYIFITEKTWHPILAEKCFLCQAAKGFHNFLKSKGFELYTEIFNYDFDRETDYKKRTLMLLEQIRKLQQEDLTELYYLIRPKIKHNKNHAIDMIRNQTDVPHVCKEFKYYNNIFEENKWKLDSSAWAN